MNSENTRRMEMAFPLFSGLDVGSMVEAQGKVASGDMGALAGFVATLGKAGQARTVRKLAAIYKATDNELRQAENDPKFMSRLEEEAADRPFRETFKETMDFFGLALGSCAPTPDSSGASLPGQETEEGSVSAVSRSGA